MAGSSDTALLFTKMFGWLYVKIVGVSRTPARVAALRFSA